MVANDMLPMLLAPFQAQGRILQEDSLVARRPSPEDFTLMGAKFMQAVTASSCCLHASLELRRGIFERIWRISCGDLHVVGMWECCWVADELRA